jgi:SPOR domain
MSQTRIMSLPVLLLAVCAVASAKAQDATQQQPLPGSMAAPLQKSRDAIAACRERRLRKELAGYKESAECSSPIIFAAWREAGYQHMDLITAWLNARETASAQVDQKTLTPAQFEQQMGDLTRRLTAEEKRRRAGLTNTPDNSLQLQLPPAGKVVGVVTPSGQEKLAKKKSADARLASTLPYDAGTNDGVGAISAFASLDAKSASGLGGPFVPAPPSVRVGPNGLPPQGASGFYAHLASQGSEADAHAAFHFLQRQYPSILDGRDAVIRRADGADGSYYRVEIGPLSAEQADQFCRSLKAAGAQCAPRYE